MTERKNRDEERIVERALDRALDGAMEAAREERRKMEAKADAKFWRDIAFPLSLFDALSRLKKIELDDVRVNLSVAKASSLNKSDLIAVLSTHVPELLPQVLERIDHARYAVLKRLADAGGQAFVDLSPREFDYFQRRGLAFTGVHDGKRTVVMPTEVMERFRELDTASLHSLVRRRSQWLGIASGLLFYYGFVPTFDLIDMVNHHTGVLITKYEAFQILHDAIRYGCDIGAVEGGFIHSNVGDAEYVIREQKSRRQLGFRSFTKQQLLQAGKQGFVDRTKEYQAFVQYLRRNYDILDEEVDSVVDESLLAMQNGVKPQDVVQYLAEEFELPNLEALQSLTTHVMNLHNNSRLWVLKGHTPMELAPQSGDVPTIFRDTQRRTAKGEVVNMATKKKIGRNDPCPCGSGKKFKKCCGR